jgi:hypothetical protein
MKPVPTILSVISTLLLAIVACALLGGGAALAAVVDPYVVTIQQVGSTVEAASNAGGEFNLTGLASDNSATVTASVFPAHPGVGLANGTANQFEAIGSGSFTGPNNFGTGGLQNAGPNNNDGPTVGLQVFPSGGMLFLQVPSTYSSGASLTSSEIFFVGATLASLGITPGTYKYTWGGTNGTADQSFTIDVIAPTTTTPLPATLPLFATGLGALGLLGWRRKRKARVSLLGVA